MIKLKKLQPTIFLRKLNFLTKNTPLSFQLELVYVSFSKGKKCFHLLENNYSACLVNTEGNHERLI